MVTTAVDGGVGTVVFDRPPANAMGRGFVEEIVAAVEGFAGDPTVRVIVLRSALDRIWMAGADLGEMAGRAGAPGEGASEVLALARRLTAVERVEKPTIAAMGGHALGGGCELAMCCDYRILVDNGRATIGLSETTLGLLPGGGGTQRLPRLIGRGPALRMIIEGTRLKAQEALAVGLVDAAPGPDDFEAVVAAKAAQLALLATRAVGLAKRAVLRGLDTTVDDGLRIESEAFAEVLGTEDVREGVGAFLEKRPPQFMGR